jgi:hypothetical protein
LIRRIATLGLGISPRPRKGPTVAAITCRSAARPEPIRGAENAEIRCRIGAKSPAAFRRNHPPLSTEIRCRFAPIFAADEAFYAGDKQHEGQLKRLVTEPTLMIEAKYANAVSVRNCLHLIVASNDDWVVPAGTDERRFFVLDVSSARQKDYEYFGSLEKELEQGGAAAMLHELLHRDLSGFNVRNVPQTSGLSDQKIRSLRGFEAWWYEALDEGKIAGIVSDDRLFTDVEEHWSEEIKVNREILYNNYVEYRREDKSRLGKFLRKYVPGLTEERPRKPDTRHRDRLYRLPPLNQCRAEFEKVIGSVEWENT